jgi:magnesium-transporting ATPase (P-type)
MNFKEGFMRINLLFSMLCAILIGYSCLMNQNQFGCFYPPLILMWSAIVFGLTFFILYFIYKIFEWVISGFKSG